MVYDNIPLNAIHSARFTALFDHFEGYKPMARRTFLKYLEHDYDQFVEKVNKLVSEIKKSSYGRKFVQILHDMWTSAAKKNCIGSGMSFLDEDFNWYFIPCFLIVNNVTHASAYNADILRRAYAERFGLDISECAKFMGSDTTNCATAISKCFEDVEQVDCEMHVLNLVLMYGMGLKEH